MGVIFSKIWLKLFDKAQRKIVLVGLNNAGKTTTLYQLYEVTVMFLTNQPFG